MKKLSRDEMKNVVGGYAATSGCCAHSQDWSGYECNLSKADAIAAAPGMGGMWCCASCAESQAQV
ncbi:MAG: hypothetical protein ABL929_07820 [Ferruginibacter sp.]|nr:rSAM-modified peptide [Ferruginibacter sp.]